MSRRDGNKKKTRGIEAKQSEMPSKNRGQIIIIIKKYWAHNVRSWRRMCFMLVE